MDNSLKPDGGPLVEDTGRGQVEKLQLPQSLKQQLIKFRGYVWSTKLVEALFFAILTGLLAFLTVYVTDRFVDTPVLLRYVIFAVSLVIWAIVPFAIYRWIWKNRRPDQLARLLRVREPDIGDQLLSVIELAENDSEQSRSRRLVQAAIGQVATRASERDLRGSAPRHWLRQLGWTIGICASIALGLLLIFPDAAKNAWGRLASPWNPIARYTFATIDELPSNLVVPHGENTPLVVSLRKDSQWTPEQAVVRIGEFTTQQAPLDQQKYAFELPPQVASTPLQVTVGDFYQDVLLEPKHRPELIGLDASVSYPEYLQRQDGLTIDARSGILSVVTGSRATLHATASRELKSAQVTQGTQESVEPSGDKFDTRPLTIEGEESRISLTWKDHDGLEGRQPFELQIKPVEDEAPSVAAQGLPRQAVVLESEQINFSALAADDFGVKRLGISWRTAEGVLVAQPAVGEKLIAAGGPEQSSLQVPATFCAASLGISPQPVEVTIFVEDYLPGRGAVHSPPYLLYVLTAEEHAIWIANQMTKWQRSAMDVRDTEMQLHESNKLLRATAGEQIGQESFVDQLRRQAALEEANGRKLNSLTTSGTDLLRQAARNPDVAVNDLEQWAKMLEVLQDIGGNRMPDVADLLKQAASNAQPNSNSSKSPAGPKVGQNRATNVNGSGAEDPNSKQEDANKDQPAVPSIVDVESSQQGSIEQKKSEEEEKQSPKKSAKPRLTLPQTAIVGPTKKPKPGEEEEEEEQQPPEQLDEALAKQQDLLAEFEKIADELNAVMANLEGSTLVKRLKAASREQSSVAEVISSRIESVFGRAASVSDEDRSALFQLSETEQTSSKSLSYIMDDMQAFYERRRTDEFKLVLEEMKSSEVLVSLQKLGEELPVEHGLSIAQAEYWADTMDRWADDLVPSPDGSKEKKKGESESKDSLPPSVILEMLKILEAEVNLREETRVAQQSQAAVEIEVHGRESARLETVQRELRDRTDFLVDAISKLPEAEKNFDNEIELLGAVSTVMDEARALLEFGDVGMKTIAAETEAIELLLQSQRINPKGGGGGTGMSPGAGGTGSTQDSALALIGNGINQSERREHRDVGQATGESGQREFPEEFRAGLDAYFESLEQNR
jgi:hypothetical protein